MASQVEDIKWVPGTDFIVDGFAFTSARCQNYFLTHCHSDHTVGLTRRFAAGTIWCSPVSARLLAAEWGLRAPVVRQLQLHQPVVINGVTVTALDANHCPGAVMLLFEVPTANGGASRCILHTGDCRWQSRLFSSSCLMYKTVDTLMLDTTYAQPKHSFPPQEEAINMMVQLMRQVLREHPNTLLVVSCYHIGKERAYLGAAAALGVQVYVPPSKLRVLQLLDLPPHLMRVLTTDSAAQLHVGCTSLVPDELQKYLAKQQGEQQQRQQGRVWTHIMGFRATGWSFRRSEGLHVQHPSDTVALVGIPYSEHSSWSDLRQCVAQLKPKKLIPTVNAATRSQRAALVDRFADLMDLSEDRSRINAYLVRRVPEAAACSELAVSPEAREAADATGTLCLDIDSSEQRLMAAYGPDADLSGPANSTKPQVQDTSEQLCNGQQLPQLWCSAKPVLVSNHQSVDAQLSASGLARPACGPLALAAVAYVHPSCSEALPKSSALQPCSSVTPPGVSSTSIKYCFEVLGEGEPSSPVLPPTAQKMMHAGVECCSTGFQPAGTRSSEDLALSSHLKDAHNLQDLSDPDIDMSLQQRLLEDAARRQRLKTSLQLQAALQAKRSKKTRSKGRTRQLSLPNAL